METEDIFAPTQILESKEPGFTLETPHPHPYTSVDNDYFDSYSKGGLHEIMLKDRPRTLAYRRAILRNRHLIKNKVVLDVGCGTGILSLFAAQAGAKLVIAVEKSGIVKQAAQIFQENGFKDTIVVVEGRIEDVELPVEKVDIIISDWMGNCLLFESMLDSVIFARDKYLDKHGKMIPDGAKLYIAPLYNSFIPKSREEFWRDVYGVNMTPMIQEVLSTPFIHLANERLISGDEALIADFDLQKISQKEIEFSSSFTLKISKRTKVNCMVVWFDIEFDHGVEQIILSTSMISTKPRPLLKLHSLEKHCLLLE